MDIMDLHFIRPLWLMAVPLALILPLLWRHFRRPSGDWSKVCDPHLLRWLSVGNPSARAGKGGTLAAIFGLLVAALSLSGPSWQQLPDASFSARDARVLVLDLSASMLAQDLKPDRLTQARFRLMDMLESTSEGQMGLVAYAGDAYVVSPLTKDMNTIANMLPALQPDIIPVAGSRADRALELAAELFERSGLSAGEILLITDGVEAGDAAVARELAQRGLVVSVLAVGSLEGAPIPSGNGFVSDAAGNVVITRIDLSALATLAEAGTGRLTVLNAASAQTGPWQEGGSTGFSLRDEALGERWKDMGPWLLLLLLPLVMAGFRRGLLFALAPFMPALWLTALLTPLVVPVPAQAGVWEDLWQRRDQQALAALEADQAELATGLARDPALSAQAWYRAGEYQRAIDAWSQLDDADAHFNRGNALAMAEQYEAAIAAYDEALAQNAGMADALTNKAIVEALKEQQDQQQQDQEGDEGEGEDSEGEGEPQPGEGEPQEGEGEQEGEPEPGEGEPTDPQGQEMEVTWSEEDAQAMEQWLRRIPDDPGGLLRRKFRNQHQRRGTPQNEKKTW